MIWLWVSTNNEISDIRGNQLDTLKFAIHFLFNVTSFLKKIVSL